MYVSFILAFNTKFLEIGRVDPGTTTGHAEKSLIKIHPVYKFYMAIFVRITLKNLSAALITPNRFVIVCDTRKSRVNIRDRKVSFHGFICHFPPRFVVALVLLTTW